MSGDFAEVEKNLADAASSLKVIKQAELEKLEKEKGPRVITAAMGRPKVVLADEATLAEFQHTKMVERQAAILQRNPLLLDAQISKSAHFADSRTIGELRAMLNSVGIVEATAGEIALDQSMEHSARILRMERLGKYVAKHTRLNWLLVGGILTALLLIAVVYIEGNNGDIALFLASPSDVGAFAIVAALFFVVAILFLRRRTKKG